MKNSSLSVLKAFVAFIFAGFIPALSAQTTTNLVAFSLATDNPGAGAVVAGSQNNKALAFLVGNTTGSAINITDMQFRAYGPVTRLTLTIDGIRANVSNVFSADGVIYYDFLVGGLAIGLHEYRLYADIGTYGAGQSIEVDLDGYSGSWSQNLVFSGSPTGNRQAVVETITLPTEPVNISARATVSNGSPLVAGFIVKGDNPATFLCRGIGPTLSSFGVSNALADPVIVIYDGSGKVVTSNQGWSTSASSSQTVQATTAVGAFPLSAGSKDSAITVTLSAGSYSVQITSASGGAGVALAEVYSISN